MITILLTIISIGTLVVLSVYPGLYLALMAWGGPGAPSNRVVRIFGILFYSVFIGFCCEVFLLFSVIAYLFISLLKFIRNEPSVPEYKGYVIERDSYDGRWYAYDKHNNIKIGTNEEIKSYEKLEEYIDKYISENIN